MGVRTPLEDCERFERLFGKDVWPNAAEGHRALLAHLARHKNGFLNNARPQMLEGMLVHCQLAAQWRQTRGIYRFDPGLEEALGNSQESDPFPASHLRRLPEPCVFLTSEMGGLFAGAFSADVFVMVESKANTISMCAFDMDASNILEGGRSFGHRFHDDDALLGDAYGDWSATKAATWLPRLLYLCTVDPDIGPPRERKRSKKTRNLLLPRTFDVGLRIGASLRQARKEAEESRQAATGAERHRPIAHVRRAHWHSYWVGSEALENRRLELRWVPPTLVNAKSSDEIIPRVSVERLRVEP